MVLFPISEELPRRRRPVFFSTKPTVGGGAAAEIIRLRSPPWLNFIACAAALPHVTLGTTSTSSGLVDVEGEA
jgi:hypothetical protein